MSSAAQTDRNRIIADETSEKRPEIELTRAHVAERLGLSISTVRRLEGTQLHPRIDKDDVRWFDERSAPAWA